MTIRLNEKTYVVEEGLTLEAFIDSLAISKQGIAIAIGYEVIPKSQWAETILTEDVELMLIQAVSGG